MKDTSGFTVVIVDDSLGLRQRVTESLVGIPGVRVVGEAADGLQAIALLEELQPQAVILDIELPLLNGIEVLKVAKNRENPPVVVMLSIFEQELFRKRCLEYGADHYFHKLTEFESVARVCRELAARG